MPEINLLANNNSRSGVGDTLALLLVRALAVVLIMLMLFFVFVFFSNRSVNTKIEKTSVQIQQDQDEIAKNSDRQRLLTRQAQLKEAKVIISNHVYWSRFFGDLAKSTLQTARFGSFASEADGTVMASVIVPDYATLDKFLQVFDLPAYNGNFSDIKIVSIAKAAGSEINELDARIRFRYNTESLKNKAAK